MYGVCGSAWVVVLFRNVLTDGHPFFCVCVCVCLASSSCSQEGIYIENDVSPDLQYVMVTTVHTPYSKSQHWPRFPQRTVIYQFEKAS